MYIAVTVKNMNFEILITGTIPIILKYIPIRKTSSFWIQLFFKFKNVNV